MSFVVIVFLGLIRKVKLLRNISYMFMYATALESYFVSPKQ